MSRGLVTKSSSVLVWRRVAGRRRWCGEGEGWRREVDAGVLVAEEEVAVGESVAMVMRGVF